MPKCNCFTFITKFTNCVNGDEHHRVFWNAIDYDVDDDNVDVDADGNVDDDVDVQHGKASAVIKLRCSQICRSVAACP